MKKTEQANTYKLRQNIKRTARTQRFRRFHYDFIKKYLRTNIRKVSVLLSLLFTQIILEMILIVSASGSLRKNIYYSYDQGSLIYLMILAIIGIALYLLIAFFALKIERELVLKFINKIRRMWFASILNSTERSQSKERQADFIAKASYHFPLISLGIDNSALGILRWILSIAVIIVIGLLGDYYLLTASICIIFGSVIISLIAYYIANYYIAQEVASYSQVLKHIDNTLSEFQFTKNANQEYTSLRGLDARVDTDTYFRVRRDVWLRYFNKVVYVVLFIATFSVFILGFYYPELINKLYSDTNTILIGVLSIYTIRLFYDAGKSGLYFPPLRLGILLSIPEILPSDIRIKKDFKWDTLEFRSNKIKLFLEGKYYKRLKITLKKGESYLFRGESRIGKSNLAQVFAGKIRFNISGWLVKVDKVRLKYSSWMKRFSESYYITPNYNSEKTIGEIIFGKDRKEINTEDLINLNNIAQDNQMFKLLLSRRRFSGESLKTMNTNPTLLFAVHILHCYISKPSIVIIDNHWLDLNYPEINELITGLRKNLENSTFIIFSRDNNDIISYSKKYEIKNCEIEEI